MQPGKILLIDDEPLFLETLSSAFQESGFAVVTAPDGFAGLKKYVDEAPDVVISDLIMPRMGGVSTCRQISRLAGDSDPVIILLTSLFQEAPHEHLSPQLGSRIHLSKSIKPVDVVILVEQLLDRKRQIFARN